MFLVFEGIDGAGTTTQAARLVSALREREHSILATAEPSKRPLGVLIRQALRKEIELGHEALALAFASDRLDHWSAEIRPALDRTQHVVCDRYLLSSLAYQSLNSPLDWISTLNGFAGRPDMTFFLRVDPEVAAARRAQRDGPADRFETDEFQRRVAARYDEVSTRDDVGPMSIIDGNRDEDYIAAAVWSEVEELLRRTELLA